MNVEGLFEVYNKKTNELKLDQTNHVLVACIKSQIIRLFNNGRRVKDYKMSSSKNPPSCLEGSLGTPWGLHQITEIIGEGEPIGMVFEGECRSDKNIGNAQLKNAKRI